MFGPPIRIIRGRKRGKGKALSIGGAWSGEYGYEPPSDQLNVPFNAMLVDLDGAITGEIDEPNTFGDALAARLRAAVEGRRAGHAVQFKKSYDGHGGVRHVVLYQGEANEDFTRIDGVWSIGEIRGPFYMVRQGEVTADAAAERAAEAGA
jgi:hypothetical protein